MNIKGYTGKILEIDLAEDKTKILKSKKEDLKRFLGGFGMNCLLAAERLTPKCSPFSRENIIVIGTGPLVGTTMPGASRTSGLSKFPATNAIANVCGGMGFGFQLKQAGYDHIIISGGLETPSYLFIDDNHIELIEARGLWGEDIIFSTNKLWKKHKDCAVIAIGKAGENLIYGALTLIDKTSTFGRGGLGAIMGSKLLKAIVIKGNQGLEIADPKEFNNKYKVFMKRIENYPHRDSWINLGMLRSLPVGMILSAKGEKKKARECSERNYLKNIKKRRIGCPSCPMADKDILEVKEGDFDGLINYTSSVINPFLMLTSDCLSSYDQAIKIYDIISRHGLDSLTMTSLVELFTKMKREGKLSDEELGFEWREDLETFEKLIDLIVNREGIGNLIADGWNNIGMLNNFLNLEKLTIKGLDVVFDPRFLKLGTMEFEQVVNPKGAHVASGGSPTYVGAGGSVDKMKSHFNRMGIPLSAYERIFTPPKDQMVLNVGRLTRYSEDWYTVLTSLGLCARAQMNRFYSIDLVTEFYNLVTGLNLKSDDLILSAERSWNLLKLLNVKEGFNREHDKFPSNWFKPLKYGDNNLNLYDFYGKIKITPEIGNKLIEDYYDERGWDKISGIPLKSKIRQLGLMKYYF